MSESRPTKPWDRIPKETAQQYAAFEIYMLLGTKRNLPAAWYKYRYDLFEDPQPAEEASSSFRRWYRDNNWAERAAAWDDHLAQVRHREQEKVVAKEARKRSVDTESLIWDTAEFLRDNLPLVQMQFMNKITAEMEDGPNATQTNQAMRVMTDQIRMVNEFAKAMGHTSQGGETDSELDTAGNDHVEELLKGIGGPSGAE